MCAHIWSVTLAKGQGSPPRGCHLGCKRSLPWWEVEALWQARGLPGGKGWCVWGTECRPGWPELLGREKERQREQRQRQPGADSPPFFPFPPPALCTATIYQAKVKGAQGNTCLSCSKHLWPFPWETVGDNTIFRENSKADKWTLVYRHDELLSITFQLLVYRKSRQWKELHTTRRRRDRRGGILIRTLQKSFFFPFIFISWRIITLQYCSGFCHTLTWISHGFTCIPHPRCPSADEWIRKLWYINTMEYYSAIKKNSFESVLMR